MCNGRRHVKQGGSDRSTGHVWAAVMDASGAVISKAFQGQNDRMLYVLLFFSVCVCVCKKKRGWETPLKAHS